MDKFYNLEKDGVTQSLLSMFLTCREKARLYLEGWNSRYTSAALMYGSLGHGMLELAYTDIKSGKLRGTPSEQQSRRYSEIAEKQWLSENPKSKVETLEQLELSLALLEKTLPRYFDFWKKDFSKVKWTALEEQFDVKAKLSEALSIRIRGKRDGMFKLQKELWLLETKTKSMVNEGELLETLGLDLQVNLYLWSAFEELKVFPEGVLYNIIRKTAMKPKVSEPIMKFAKRVAEDMDDRPEFYFTRLEVAIAKPDMLKFKDELMGLLADFSQWRTGKIPHYKNPNNCVGKYGRCEYLGACSSNDYSGLAKRKMIFKELSDF